MAKRSSAGSNFAPNIGRARKAAGSVVLAAAAALSACSSSGAVLRSNHYRLVVPTGWQATEERGVAVLHVPQAAGAPGGGKLDLRLHAWLVDRAVEQPIQESVKRLTEQGTAQLQPAGDATEETCGEQPHGFQLFGQAQSAAHMRTPSGDYVVVTAAQTSGSLIAAVGIVPNSAPLCENLRAMTAAIDSLRDTLTPAEDPTVARRPPVMLDSPIPGRPSTEVAAPSSLP